MVGAGKLIELLFGMPYVYAEILVGALMITYVAFGGMVATTWVQIIKACLLLGGATFLALMVLLHFDFSAEALFRAAAEVHPGGLSILSPGKLVTDPISAVSLGLALMFGTAGLPHILMRFFTVRDAKAARKSVFFATGFIGYFYILTFIIGFGAITFLMNDPSFFMSGEGGSYDKNYGPAGRYQHGRHPLVQGSRRVAVSGLHLGGRVRDHSRRGRWSDARRCVRGEPRPLCQRHCQGSRFRTRGGEALEDRGRRHRRSRNIAGLRIREAERRLHGGPRIRSRGELQFSGAAHERGLGRHDDPRRARRRAFLASALRLCWSY